MRRRSSPSESQTMLWTGSVRAFSHEAHWARISFRRLIRERCALEPGPLLFAEEELPWRPAYDPAEIRDRLQTVLVKMRAAASWPWKPATISFYRETLWPTLLGKLPYAEAAQLRCEIDAEITRLDAVQ